ncbi:MAG: mechanosensitive ion channel [Candidatus Anstonellales archaeon]
MDIQSILAATFIFLTLVVIFKIAIGILFRFAAGITKKTKTKLDDMLLQGLAMPINMLAFVIALILVLLIFFPEGSIMGYSNNLIIKLAMIIVGIVVIERGFKVAANYYLAEIAKKTETTLDDEYVPLLRDIGGIIIYIVGAIVLLSEIGIDVAPLIAGLGIAGLAVALALQDTLTNFFAGVHIFIDRPFKTGDFIELAGLGTTTPNLLGRVEHVGWRTTKIRDFQNNVFIIPNSKVAQTTIKNFEMEYDRGTIVVLEVGVAYGNDIDKVKESLIKAGKAVQSREEGANKNREVEARFDRFGDSAMIFKLFMPVVDYKHNFTILHKTAREVVRQFKKDKIEIPFPQLDLHIKEGKL